MTRIYTKTGDRGMTSLFGGRQVPKDHDRLEAYGTLDELNAVLGWFRSRGPDPDLDALAASVQARLFDLGAHLATPADAGKARGHLPPFPAERVRALEAEIDRLEGDLPPLTRFILPGGTEAAAILHLARAVCRRAERAVVRVLEREHIPPEETGLAWLNRLSDLLFVMSRTVNRRGGVEEETWAPEPGADPAGGGE